MYDSDYNSDYSMSRPSNLSSSSDWTPSTPAYNPSTPAYDPSYNAPAPSYDPAYGSPAPSYDPAYNNASAPAYNPSAPAYDSSYPTYDSSYPAYDRSYGANPAAAPGYGASYSAYAAAAGSTGTVSKEDLPPQYRPLSAWAYWGLSLLYTVPIVGFVFMIVFSFSKGNINRRSFTRAYWIHLLIAVIIIAILLLTGVLSAGMLSNLGSQSSSARFY